MKNAINLNSQEWCDIIFEGKNKSYGAYDMRQSSARRHLIAFGLVIIFAIFIAFLPTIISSVKAVSSAYAGKMEEGYEVTVIEAEPKQIEEIIETKMPEPPKFIESIKFAPPVIAPDVLVSEENELHDMDKIVNAKTAVIGLFDVEHGSKDEDAILKRKEEENIVGGTGGGGPAKIFTTAELMPQFPGGEKEMYQYIGQKLKYPSIDIDMGTEGRVVIRFVVSQTGEIKDVEVLKGISPTCDKEAVRVVKSMPRWIPGKQNGTPVQVYYTLPIVFKLSR